MEKCLIQKIVGTAIIMFVYSKRIILFIIIIWNKYLSRSHSHQVTVSNFYSKFSWRQEATPWWFSSYLLLSRGQTLKITQKSLKIHTERTFSQQSPLYRNIVLHNVFFHLIRCKFDIGFYCDLLYNLKCNNISVPYSLKYFV